VHIKLPRVRARSTLEAILDNPGFTAPTVESPSVSGLLLGLATPVERYSAGHPKGSPAKAPPEGADAIGIQPKEFPGVTLSADHKILRGAVNVPVWNFTFRTRKRPFSILKPGFWPQIPHPDGQSMPT
jgi:hypothetical protein